jgi:hypothetical protein
VGAFLSSGRVTAHPEVTIQLPFEPTERGCGKRLDFQGIRPRNIPQGLKPIDFIGFIGTTEVVPCYKAPELGVFPQHGSFPQRQNWEFFRSLWRVQARFILAVTRCCESCCS